MKKLIAILLTLTLVFCLVACAREAEKPATSEASAESETSAEETEESADKPKIGYICGNPTWQGWLIISTGVTDAAAELENEVEYVYTGIANSSDTAAYINAMEDMVNMGVEAIVLGAADPSLADTIDSYVANGTIIVEIDSPSGAVSTYNMGIDNYAGAKLAAEWIGEALGGEGNVVSVNGSQNNTSGSERRNGFVLELNKQFPNIEVFEVATKWTQEEALNGIDDAFASLGEENIDAIFCAWDGATVVVSNNLEERGLLGKVLLCGFDGAADALQMMKEGKIDADVAQPLYGMGYEGFHTAYKLVKGEKIGELKVNLATKLVLKENIDDWIVEGHLEQFLKD